ncbi:hypothetical protein BN1224_CV14_A_03770 [Chlamydia pneumoniae]|uniref:Uncharacterized protein n=1 Tax=Chlamydia pneumoniae TaxID=83558 RepID=A0A0F7XBM0_CHLPN|nr:hypothetical protein BN1224_Wien1_A_03750 [Chlamydia pneumoniae]CRI35731.1 hypothetical protein BN1224_CM1_A_03780 [Chlamydia pneumoniae]CRI36858.1 hypothetical protein BN1224_CV14_A_03770 [Chlamydia pneumoniae]CRI37981.1 hypothetical protein BN1224_CV15_B_03040 [Chlamydia pneumoniae]CRI39116.1 hypothetical protein BN1224_CWL011_A_03800 [Chlamydia pneumoniae]
MVLVIKYLFKGKDYILICCFLQKIFFFDNKDFYKFFLISLILMS